MLDDVGIPGPYAERRTLTDSLASYLPLNNGSVRVASNGDAVRRCLGDDLMRARRRLQGCLDACQDGVVRM
jgi:hypothetical protein